MTVYVNLYHLKNGTNKQCVDNVVLIVYATHTSLTSLKIGHAVVAVTCKSSRPFA